MDDMYLILIKSPKFIGIDIGLIIVIFVEYKCNLTQELIVEVLRWKN